MGTGRVCRISGRRLSMRAGARPGAVSRGSLREGGRAARWAGALDKESAGRLSSTAAPVPRRDALSPAKITAFSSSAQDLVRSRKDDLNIRYWGRVPLVVLWEGAVWWGGVRWDEDLGFLQSRIGMESREGTMGPRTAIPLTPPLSPPELRDRGFPGAPGVFKAISVLNWRPEASP